MTLPVLPNPLVESLERRLETAATLVRSGFTGATQVQDWGGEWWAYRFEMALTRGGDGRALSAFFAALGGVRGRFLFTDPTAASEPGAGSPVVLTPDQGGHALVTGNWAADQRVMRAGDLLSLGTGGTTRLYQVTEDAWSEVTGVATLRIVPRLRASPPVNAPVEISAPQVLLRLTAPVPTRIGRSESYRFTVTAREAL